MIITDVTGYPRQSHKKIIIKCDLAAIEKCLGTVERAYRDAMDNMSRNDGLFACYNCARHTKMAGRNNQNCKYKELDDHWMDEIDTEEKSYIHTLYIPQNPRLMLEVSLARQQNLNLNW